jgi:hypothetical protein
MRKHSPLKTFLAVLVLAGASLVSFPENQKVVKEYTVVIAGVSDSVGNSLSPPNNNTCDDSANNDDRDRLPRRSHWIQMVLGNSEASDRRLTYVKEGTKMKKSGIICLLLSLIVLATVLELMPRAIAKSGPIPAKTPAAGVASAFSLPESMKSSRAALPQILEGYGGLPLNFEANQGQSDPSVKFISRGNGYSVYLTSTEAVLVLSSRGSAENSKSPESNPRYEALGHSGNVKHGLEQIRRDRGKDAVLRIQLLGANSAASPVGSDELPGKLNYFLGNDPAKWRTGVPMFANVRYENVYPGVDLVYHGDHRQLEYDFIVAPGAEPDLIRMSFVEIDREQRALPSQVHT